MIRTLTGFIARMAGYVLVASIYVGMIMGTLVIIIGATVAITFGFVLFTNSIGMTNINLFR